MANKHTHSVYCTSCGGYIGEAVPAYTRSMQCFCGEVMVVASLLPVMSEQPETQLALAS